MPPATMPTTIAARLTVEQGCSFPPETLQSTSQRPASRARRCSRHKISAPTPMTRTLMVLTSWLGNQ
jgi:hypothetical protein